MEELNLIIDTLMEKGFSEEEACNIVARVFDEVAKDQRSLMS